MVRAVHDMRLGDWRERQRGDAAVGRLDHVVLDSCRHDLGLCCELTSEKIRSHDIIIMLAAMTIINFGKESLPPVIKDCLILTPRSCPSSHSY